MRRVRAGFEGAGASGVAVAALAAVVGAADLDARRSDGARSAGGTLRSDRFDDRAAVCRGRCRSPLAEARLPGRRRVAVAPDVAQRYAIPAGERDLRRLGSSDHRRAALAGVAPLGRHRVAGVAARCGWARCSASTRSPWQVLAVGRPSLVTALMQEALAAPPENVSPWHLEQRAKSQLVERSSSPWKSASSGFWIPGAWMSDSRSASRHSTVQRESAGCVADRRVHVVCARWIDLHQHRRLGIAGDRVGQSVRAVAQRARVGGHVPRAGRRAPGVAGAAALLEQRARLALPGRAAHHLRALALLSNRRSAPAPWRALPVLMESSPWTNSTS